MQKFKQFLYFYYSKWKAAKLSHFRLKIFDKLLFGSNIISKQSKGTKCLKTIQ